MKKALSALQMTVRVAGMVLIVLGVLFWLGVVTSLVSLHIAIGVLFALALVGMAITALQTPGGSRAIPVVAIVWAALMVVLGLTQGGLVPGGAHWVVQVIHLLVGIVAIGLGEAIGASTGRRLGAARPS